MSLWKIRPDALAASNSPFNILNKYAKMVSDDTDDKFRGLVYDNKIEFESVVYSFYILVPDTRVYKYKLFDVKLDTNTQPYPLILKHYINNALPKTFRCMDSKEFEKDLVSAISSIDTQNILAHIEYLIKVKEEQQ